MRLRVLVTIACIVAICLIPSAFAAIAPDPEPAVKLFSDTVNEVATLLKNRGIQLDPGEDLLDVSAFVLLNAAARNGLSPVTAGIAKTLQQELISEAGIWSWFPLVPKDKKDPRVKTVRRALAAGSYARTVTLLAGGSTNFDTFRNERFVLDRGTYPTMTAAIWYAKARNSTQLLDALSKGEISYNELLRLDLLQKYGAFKK